MNDKNADGSRPAGSLADEISALLRAGFAAAFPGCPEAEAAGRAAPSSKPGFGDFQCSGAMQLARALRIPPRAVAEKAVAAMPASGLVEKAEVAGPGYVNVTVRPEALAARAAAIAEDPAGGVPQTGRGKTVVVDYSSPNVAKSMHVGHIRSTVIGAAIVNLYRALGYEVVGDNHIGDWGTQFGIIIKGWREFVDREALARDPVAELERIYKESNARAKDDPEWMTACRMETVKLQSGDPENRALWQDFIRMSRHTFDEIYARLGISFETTRGESWYQPQLAPMVERLVAAGLAKESRGAIVVDLRDFDPAAAAESRKAVETALAKGDEESAAREDGKWICIVRKEDGGFNYNTTDLATMETRQKDYAPAKIVIVTDDRQIPHFKQLFAISAKLGLVSPETETVHVAFGTITDADGHPFSTRKGGMPKLKELLDEAAARALAIVKEKNPDLPEAEASALAEAIGIGAVKYSDLAMDPATTIRFSWDSILSLQGNSGPYLQYAHARIRSLLAKYAAAFPGEDWRSAPAACAEPLERALARRIVAYPETVAAAAAKCKPSVLADYLYGLAQDYSAFYQALPVLKSADPAVRAGRARLCGAVAEVLKRGLALLGIVAPDRM
ncbi:MAG: arginine--tRNA ligase [Kiritimatiellae bacterium]|nr:arginine--tRNA ligase [Kiritimatiellia bacterium]